TPREPVGDCRSRICVSVSTARSRRQHLVPVTSNNPDNGLRIRVRHPEELSQSPVRRRSEHCKQIPHTGEVESNWSAHQDISIGDESVWPTSRSRSLHTLSQ